MTDRRVAMYWQAWHAKEFDEWAHRYLPRDYKERVKRFRALLYHGRRSRDVR